MNPFQKLVLRMLLLILERLAQIPGVAVYAEDENVISDAEEAIVGNTPKG